MCFSMDASFGAGAILLTVGFAAVSQSGTRQQHLLSVIPILFSLQQFIEGLLWFSLQNKAVNGWRQPLLYLFLVLAQVVWPLFIPLCTLQMETQPRRRKILISLSIIGALTAVLFLYGLFFYSTDVSIGDHHIRYVPGFPFLHQWYGGIPYLAAAVAAPLISSVPRMRLIGVLLLASYLMARLYYNEYLISVWCYFATVISLVALYDIMRRNKARSTGNAYQ